MRDKALSLLQELTEAHSVPGHEDEVRAIFVDELGERVGRSNCDQRSIWPERPRGGAEPIIEARIENVRSSARRRQRRPNVGGGVKGRVGQHRVGRFAAKAGCDPKKLHEIVMASAGASWMLGNRGPRMMQADPEVTSAVDIFIKDLGLVEVPSYVWRDVIFVNISGEAPPFEVAHRAAIERWREFDQPLHHSGDDSGFRLDVATNWKLALENYCESYHLPWVHPGLNSYSRLEDHYNIEEPDAFSGQGTLVYRQVADEQGRVFPDAPGLGERWRTAAEYIALYPNVLFGVHRDHSFAILLEPVAIDRTVEHVEIYYHAEQALDADHAGLRAHNSALWKTVFKEDIFVVEGMQQGRHASGFDGGKFSPVMDSPTHMFHRWVASRLA